MANDALKKLARDKKIPLWRIADVLGVHEITLVRRLRHELSPEDKRRIRHIIEALTAENDTK